MKSKFRVLAMIICFILLYALILPTSAASNPYPTSQTFNGVTTIPCTYYAWQQAYDKLGVIMPNFGNAKNWYSRAQDYGYAVGTVAKPNSIAVWTSDYGHVAYVVSVSGTSMTVNEGGMTNSSGTAAANGTGIINGSVCPSTVGSKKSSYSSNILVGFIYLSTDNVSVLTTQTGKTDSITDTNAYLYGTVKKVQSSNVNKLGMRIALNGKDYSTGKTYAYTPNSDYTHTATVYIWFDINDELKYYLTHATTYKYQFYAQIDGKDYWSAEKTFTTTGSHSFGAWTTSVKPTCTQSGTKRRSCACGYTESGTVTATGHSYSSQWTIDTAATCVSVGSRSRHCTVCGAKTDITSIPATGHSLGEWVTVSKPNCTQSGAKQRKCACGYTESGTVTATGHSYSSQWTTDKAATCVDKGTKSHHCTVCGAKTDITDIPATGHSFGKWSVEIQVSTENDGREARTCSSCGKKEIRTIPKLPTQEHVHEFGEWQQQTAPTCTAEGVYMSKCASCDATQTKTVAPAGHEFGEWVLITEGLTTYKERRCDNCDEAETIIIEVIEPIVSEPEESDTVIESEAVSDEQSAEAEDSVEAESKTDNDEEKPNVIMPILLVVIIVVLAGGLVVALLKIKKLKH